MSDEQPKAATAGSGAWSSDIFAFMDDPVTCIIGCCLPCVLYGQSAEKVHGGDMVNHCLKYFLYSCICACGLVHGPTRTDIRETYGLPIQPDFLESQGTSADCLTATIPYIANCALCQESRELNARGVTSPIKPVDFVWGPVTSTSAPAAATEAPAQAEMTQ